MQVHIDPPPTPIIAPAEDYASKEPNHVYKIIMYAPLHGETYQRNNKGEWVLINTNRGFA